MSVMKEFREFAMKGNVVDLAVGVIIGGAFGRVVSSVVSDILMPPIGMALGGVDFSNLMITLKSATADAPAVALRYGQFFNTAIDFVIIAGAIFFMIRLMNSMRKAEPAPAFVPTSKSCPECLMAVPLLARRCGHCASDIT